MHAELVAMLTTTLQHAAYTGTQDGYGVPTYAAPAARLARLEWKTTRFVNAQGEERMSHAIAYLVWDFTLDLRDTLTFPDGTSPVIQRIDAYEDEAGSHDHYKLFF